MTSIPFDDRQIEEGVTLHLDVQDLYEASCRPIMAGAAVLGWALAIDAARMGAIPTAATLSPVLLFAGTAVCGALLGRRPRLATLVLSLVLAASHYFLLFTYAGVMPRYSGVIVLMATASIMPLSVHSALTAAMCLASLAIEALSPGTYGGWVSLTGVIALMVLAALVSWSSRRPLVLALNWASQSTSRALELTEALRQRQSVLNRTLRAMDEANARLTTMNRRLAEARRAADQALRVKSLFAANISHELRTPLNLIVGFAEVMYRTPHAYPDVALSPEFLIDLEVIYRNAQHLQHLVDDVLDLSELDLGKMVIRPQETKMGPLVREAAQAVGNLIETRGLTLVTHIDPDLPSVVIDHTRIKQVVLNLLSNAARYTDKGAVTVTVWHEDRRVFCAVRDTGPGIAPEKQKLLFQEFERVEDQTTAGRRGFGLGLAISKRFVQAHGGEIWVESTPGQGSTFTFSLPTAQDAHLAGLIAGRETTPASATTSARHTVVLVTPSFVAARVFSRHMEGFHCLVARDVAQAKRHIAHLQPTGILVDAAMSTQDIAAIETCARSGGQVGATPLVVCPMPGETLGLGLGPAPAVKGFLSKPITRDDLISVLRTIEAKVDRLLIVDDDEHILRLFTHHLRDSVRPYHISTARNGREALEIARATPPDLIFLDLLMPVMDGYRFIHEAQTAGIGDIPIVIISGQEVRTADEPIQGTLELRVPGGIALASLLNSVNRLLQELVRHTERDAGQ